MCLQNVNDNTMRQYVGDSTFTGICDSVMVVSIYVPSECADSGIGIPGEMTSQCNGAGTYTLSGSQLALRQFWAQIVKRFHHMRRSKKAFLVQVKVTSCMVFSM